MGFQGSKKPIHLKGLENEITDAHLPGLPPDLDALCVALMQRDPAARPAAREVLTALGRGEGVPVVARVLAFVGARGWPCHSPLDSRYPLYAKFATTIRQ